MWNLKFLYKFSHNFHHWTKGYGDKNEEKSTESKQLFHEDFIVIKMLSHPFTVASV